MKWGIGRVIVAIFILTLTSACFATQAKALQVEPPVYYPTLESVLADKMLVTWYGNPNAPRMGILGQYSGAELATRLRTQASAYASLTSKDVIPTYELIAVVAQGSAGADGMWRRRESKTVIDSMLQQARSHGFKLVLDIQLGKSTVQDEMTYLQPWLEQPEVYLALDPEFDMWRGQVPGQEIGHISAEQVSYALNYLTNIIQQNGLPPKVLIVHQFTLDMVPDKAKIESSPVVDLVLDMDGFGSQSVKNGTWNTIMNQGQLEYSGIKLFYDQDTGIFSPQQVMKLRPTPSLVIYQ